MSQSGRYVTNGGGGAGIETLTGNTGGPVGPTGNNVNVPGSHGLNSAGNPGTSTVTFAINNNITLGDLSNITAGNDALTIDTGNITINANNTVGNLNLPLTSSDGNAGVITQGGQPFIYAPNNGSVYIGQAVGSLSTGGGNNFILGSLSGQNITTAVGNIFMGNGSGASITTGQDNIGIGTATLDSMQEEVNNVAIGTSTLEALGGAGSSSSVGYNTAVGFLCLESLQSGSFNLALGYGAGTQYFTNESSNILLSNDGVTGESNVIRIGDQGTGIAEQNTCYIAGIIGNTVSNAQFVTIDSVTGQLGVTTGGTGATTFDTDSGTATESGGTITIAGAHDINTSGTSATVTVALNNNITLGDLSNLTTDALTISTGNVTLSATNHYGNINMPQSDSTTAGTSGIYNLAGLRFLWTPYHSGGSGAMLGFECGNLTSTGTNNYAVGYRSFFSSTSANDNCCMGTNSLLDITTGAGNVAIGHGCMTDLTTGSDNTSLGFQAGGFLKTGSFNTSLGYNAGTSYASSESSNICLGSTGTGGESNVIRIGTSGTGTAQQSSCYIAGISGVTVTGTAVLCSTSGQLGTISSSERFKENIEDIPANDLLSLRPVQFSYKNDSTKKKCYGLIAEEVEKVFPELVVYDEEKNPYSVSYYEIVPLLLSELQKTNARIQALEKKLSH